MNHCFGNNLVWIVQDQGDLNRETEGIDCFVSKLLFLRI